ncbi:MAG: FdhF/YdeP family oxidoreductase [Thiomargarita sp.]|nr:FdhF/YdeP family oxidoreductase [Thiomargarita sp.]
MTNKVLNPYIDTVRAMWKSRNQLGFAWRILNDGVCDGCALGSCGMRDWTISGIHLCWIRLNLLHINTMPALNSKILADVAPLQNKTEKSLRELGRLAEPMIRRKGDKGFQAISWQQALELISGRIKAIEDRNRLAFYMTSRGAVNESYYVAQKVIRFLGTNNIDNSARICHAPSTVGLKQAIGYAASTCSYKDWIGSDLLVFIGCNPANNNPVAMKYIELAKKQGAKIVVINPIREPGMEKFWQPSSIGSAIFGKKIMDNFFQIKSGGDIAFINGVLKHIVANDWMDKDFIQQHSQGWDVMLQALAQQDFSELEQQSGASEESMLELAQVYSQAKTAVFLWSMGITMHSYGVENIRAIANLALSRGMIGKPNTGMVALRGQSSVQGGAEMGAVPNQFPGGNPVDETHASKFSEHWGFEVPTTKGQIITDMMRAAHKEELDVFYCVGSNLFNVLPDTNFVQEALHRIPLRIHHDVVFNQQMLVEPKDTVLLLPATTRYEMAGGNTETSTERRIIFNPEIPGRRIPEARDEWRVLTAIAKLVNPEQADKVQFNSTAEIRAEISKLIPTYQGVDKMQTKGDQMQWGGERLGENYQFKTPDGKAHFAALVSPQQASLAANEFHLITRRGKQFNSIIFADDDMFTGLQRHEVFMSAADLNRLNLNTGDKIQLHSAQGEWNGVVKARDLPTGTLMMSWPEANLLTNFDNYDSQCGMPAYQEQVVKIR